MGKVKTAVRLCEMQFDKILFTGSSEKGKLVA
jgi:hypothetical protein